MYGNRLRELRLEYGYTMEEVGQELGIKKSSYASYESKYRQPPLEKLKGLSKLYGVSVDYILGLTNERTIDESIQIRLREILSNSNCLHWDGLEVPKEVLVQLEQVLDRVVQRMLESPQYRKEG